MCDPDLLGLEVGQHWKDGNGNIVTIIRQFQTCCSPVFWHGGIANQGVFCYDFYGRRMNQMLSPIYDRSTTLIERLYENGGDDGSN